MEKWPWGVKIAVMGICSVAFGMIPVLALMWANYHFDPNICWPNEYGGWYIVPMIFSGVLFGFGMNVYMERKLKVCDHG